jgi:hypothetical protein
MKNSFGTETEEPETGCSPQLYDRGRFLCRIVAVEGATLTFDNFAAAGQRMDRFEIP